MSHAQKRKQEDRRKSVVEKNSVQSVETVGSGSSRGSGSSNKLAVSSTSSVPKDRKAPKSCPIGAKSLIANHSKSSTPLNVQDGGSKIQKKKFLLAIKQFKEEKKDCRTNSKRSSKIQDSLKDKSKASSQPVEPEQSSSRSHRQDVSTQEKDITPNDFPEDAMEWEPSESEIITSLHELRRNMMAQHNLDSPTNIASRAKMLNNDSNIFHIVIDTNIFLSHLPTVKMLAEGGQLKSPVKLYVPWTVLQELDFMKTNKDNKNKLELLARKAVSYISEKQSSLLRIETLEEYKCCQHFLPAENADDSILQWCLFLKKEEKKNVILLSNDIMFCTKAKACGVDGQRKEEFIDKLSKINSQCDQPNIGRAAGVCDNVAATVTNKIDVASSLNTSRIENVTSSRASRIENVTSAIAVEGNLINQFEKCLVEPLSQVLEYEMRQVYGDLWLRIVLVKPPWKLWEIFRCVEKHWIAVFSYIYPNQFRENVEFLKTNLNHSRPVILEAKQQEDCIDVAIMILESIKERRSVFDDVLLATISSLKKLRSINSDSAANLSVLDMLNYLWDHFNSSCQAILNASRSGSTSVIPSYQRVADYVQVLLPPLTRMELAMSKFLQAEVGTPNSQAAANDFSSCILSTIAQLDIKIAISKDTSVLTCAIIAFCTDLSNRVLMRNGLSQLGEFLNSLQEANRFEHRT